MTTGYIENPVAYENAIKRNIIGNAKKTWRRNTERSFEIEGALVDGIIYNSYGDFIGYTEDFMGSMARSFDVYGKLSEKQCQAILKGIDARIARKAEWADKQALLNAQRTHIGAIGEKMNFTVTLKKIVTWTSAFGLQFLYIMEDANQNIIIYKGKSEVIEYNEHGQNNLEGDILKFTATIKEHGVRDGVKQTVIQRPKLAK
jgi:hypothetical protein